MKKTLLVLLILTLVIGTVFTGCSQDPVAPVEPDGFSSPIVIGTLNGPTGMGMVGLMDQTDKYDITAYQAPDEISGKIITGELDMACLPSNMASVLYNKTEGAVVVVSVNTLGVLYIVENGTQTVASVEDLAGKTLYGSGKGAGPEFILQELLDKAGVTDVDIQWMANHNDAASSCMANEGSLALIPEPFVTVVGAKNPDVHVAIDLNASWADVTGVDLPMGVIIAQKSFVEERGDDIAVFLADYRESVDFVNSSPDAGAAIAEWGFIADAAVAQKAIPNSNIVLYEDDFEATKSMLEAYFQVLFNMNPASLGGAIPDEGFYY